MNLMILMNITSFLAKNLKILILIYKCLMDSISPQFLGANKANIRIMFSKSILVKKLIIITTKVMSLHIILPL
jgi:helix-turn-helix protein